LQSLLVESLPAASFSAQIKSLDFEQHGEIPNCMKMCRACEKVEDVIMILF